MKKNYLAILFFAAGLQAYAQDFVPGSIVVSRTNESGAVTIATGGLGALPTDIVAYSPTNIDAEPLTTVTNATLASGANFTVSASNNSEGHLNRSADGRFLVTHGNNVGVGVATNSAGARDKVIARIGHDRSTTLIPYTATTDGIARPVVSDDGNQFWYMTGNSILNYLDNTATPATPVLNVFTGAGTRTAMLFKNNGALRMFSVYSFGNIVAVNQGGAPPIANASGVATPIFTGAPSAASIGFLDMDPNVSYDGTGYDVMYVGVMGDNLPSSGPFTGEQQLRKGIHKFHWNGNEWVNNGTVETPHTPDTRGAGHLVVTKTTTGKPIIYWVSVPGGTYAANNSIYFTVDNGTRFDPLEGNAVSRRLVSAGPTSVFKGIAFAPTQAPSDNPIINEVALPLNIKSDSAPRIGKISLYPNPTSDRFVVQNPKVGTNGTIIIRSIDGKKVSEFKLDANKAETELNISKLPAGTYIIVVDNGRKYSAPLVKY